MNTSRKIINVLLFCTLIGLLVYACWLNKDIYERMAEFNVQMLETSRQQAAVTRTYSGLYHETRIQLAGVTDELKLTRQKYQESQQLLASVSAELENMRAALARASAIIDEATEGKVQLPADLLAMTKARRANLELENSLSALQIENEQLSHDIKELTAQLNRLSGDISSIDEGKSVLSSLHRKIKSVKTKISYFKRQANDIRIAAFRERDRVRLMVGNRGYMTRDGQLVKVDMKQYHAESLESLQTVKEASSKNNTMQIDVGFFNNN